MEKVVWLGYSGANSFYSSKDFIDQEKESVLDFIGR